MFVFIVSLPPLLSCNGGFFTSNVKVCIIIKKDLQSLPKCIIFESTIKRNKMKKTTEQMEKALRSINFFVGGLTDEGIIYYYNKMKSLGKL